MGKGEKSPFLTMFSKGLLSCLKLECCGKGLTHSHTMTPLNAPGKQAF